MQSSLADTLTPVTTTPTKAIRARGVTKSPTRMRPLLILTVATLPISYIPHEIVAGGVPVQSLSLALVVLCAIRYRAFRGHWTGIEITSWLMVTWILTRLGLGVFESRTPDFNALISAVAGIVAGIVLLRIARHEDLRPSIIRGLRIALLMMVAWELYQVAAGLPRLLSLGYIAPEFNYNTASGEYRPFSLFKSPVVYGTYLAIVSATVVFTARRWAIWIYGGIAAVGLFLTETRSAWIALIVAVVLAISVAPRVLRRRFTIALFPLAWLVTIGVLLRPDIVDSLFNRLGTVFDLGYNSNSIRLILWQGTLDAAAAHPLEGYGLAPFVQSLTPYIGYSYAAFAHPHSNYLQALYLYGGIGLLLFVSMLIAGFRATTKKGCESTVPRVAGTAALAAFAITSFFESTWTSYNVMATLLLCIGIGMLPLDAKSADKNRPALGRRAVGNQAIFHQDGNQRGERRVTPPRP